MEILCKIFLLFIIYSIIGWIFESIYVFIIDKKFFNRGFLIGPYCPIYGIGCIAIIYLLEPFKSYPLLLLLMTILSCSILEYFTSYILEKVFNARWWDYSNCKFNINGRICMQTMIPFGIGGLFVTYIINPFIQKLINGIPINTLYIITIIVAIIYFTDLIISSKVVFQVNKSLDRLSKDNTQEIKEKVKSWLLKQSYFSKR